MLVSEKIYENEDEKTHIKTYSENFFCEKIWRHNTTTFQKMRKS